MKLQRIVVGATMAVLLASPAFAQQGAGTRGTAPAPQLTHYAIDTVHSELSFRIRHLFGRVAGTFGNWEGVVSIDTLTPANSRVDVTIRTASIDTRVPQRDDHLRTSDFLAVDSFPTMTFRSTNVTWQGRTIRIVGNLTLRGHTQPVVLVGTYEGRFKDPWGQMRTAFIASGTINRQDFGVSFNAPFETIGQIGDEVWIEIAIEAVQQ
jgi:polyisoprenoid-binding protein YceI